MAEQQYSISQRDGYHTLLCFYESPEKANAGVLILHGMAEHKERYLPFIKYLNANGIDAYIYNHRGHGTDKSMEELGFFDCTNGDQKVIEDAERVLAYVMKNKRCDKLILLGHSMGSLITRNLIQKIDNLNGVILSGTTNPSKIKSYPGLMLSTIIKLIFGAKHRSPLINQLIFGAKSFTSLSNNDGNSSKLKALTSFDWLTRNKTVVADYAKDPFCGFICTISFYQDLLKLTLHACNTILMSHSRKDLPINIISGDRDPVGNYGNEIKLLYNNYQKLGFTNVVYKLYPNCRHELLQELNSDVIMRDIVTWIENL